MSSKPSVNVIRSAATSFAGGFVDGFASPLTFFSVRSRPSRFVLVRAPFQGFSMDKRLMARDFVQATHTFEKKRA